MTRLFATLAAVGIAATALGAQGPPLETFKDKLSYCIGLSIGRNIRQEKADVDTDILARGIKDALTGAKPALTDQQMQEVMTAFQKQLRAQHEDRDLQLADFCSECLGISIGTCTFLHKDLL